jgi:hypothetical protein
MPLLAPTSDSMTGELLQRESDLQSDLIALNLAVLDRSAHLPDFEPAEISQCSRCLLDRIVDCFGDALLRRSDNFNDL